jgi:DNA-binding MarR family transcriptional regulator
MSASGTNIPVEELAHQLMELVTQFNLALPRGRRRVGDLKEIEFLTLSILSQHETRIVGDIQRRLGVLPAQMSRIIRSLEARERPYIACRINAQDKRKIDVTLTPSGARAFEEHQKARVQSIAGLLAKMSEDDLEDLQRLLERANEHLGPSRT